MIGAALAKREVRKGFNRINQHDLEGLLAMFADDGVFEFPEGTSIGGRHEGPEAIRAWFERWFTRMPEIHFTVKQVAAVKSMTFGASNVVYAEWDLDERDQEGNAYHLTGMTAFHAKGGKAKLIKDYIFDQDVVAEIWSAETSGVR